MFDNIGGKIKGLAKFVCWLGIILSFVFGFILITSATVGSGYLIVAGIVLIVGGSILSWIGSFVLYGFGELVENSSDLVRMKKDEIQSCKTRQGTTSQRSYSNESKLDSTVRKPNVNPKQWTCPHCGKSNPMTTSICICGTDRPSK